MRFRLLGPLQVWAGDAWLTVRAAQQRLLLAVLLIEAGRVVSVDRLVDELWGDRPPARAAATVQVYVGRLRRLLGDDAADRLVTRGSGYQLIVDDADLDAAAFERLIADARAERAAGRLEAAAESFREALGLWHGPALTDVPESLTVIAQATRWGQARLGAMEDRMATQLELGRHTEVVDELHQLVHEHPLREQLQAYYIVALYRGGRRSDALAAYRRARQVLIDEVGLEPGPELRGIEKAILADDRQPPAAPATLPTTLHAPAAPRPVAQLPPGFTGRTGQLEQLLDQLTHSHHIEADGPRWYRPLDLLRLSRLLVSRRPPRSTRSSPGSRTSVGRSPAGRTSVWKRRTGRTVLAAAVLPTVSRARVGEADLGRTQA